MKWLRLDTDMPRNPKVAKLSNADFRFWIELLCLAAENNGLLPDNANDLATALKERSDTVVRAVSRLRSAGLIDVLEEGLRPHNWEKYHPKSMLSTERVKRFREKGNVSETFNDTIRYDTIHKKENIKEKSSPKKRSQIAENAEPSESNKEVGKRAGMSDHTIDYQWGKFRAHHRAKGSLMADWGQAWVTWCTNWKGEYGAKQAPSATVTPMTNGRGRGTYKPGIGMVYPDGTVYSMLHNREP